MDQCIKFCPCVVYQTKVLRTRQLDVDVCTNVFLGMPLTHHVSVSFSTEHRNMPLDDALTLITRNFVDYDKARREKSAEHGVTVKHPDSEISYLLNLLADSKYLKIDELNKVIRYLSERRDALIVKEGGVLPPKLSGQSS